MARLILETGDGAGDIGNSIDVDVIGTNAAETIRVSNNARGTFDGSFSRGNDIIYIDGNAANYSIRQTGPNQVVITNATGANLVIPVGTGVTIQFADVTVGRVLSFNSSNAIVLGSQTITATASTITAGTPGSTGGNELFLVVAQDVLVGTASADTFVADLIQNPLGEQTNSLGTGDRLTGGDGTDTLEAHLQDASPLNGGPGSSIAPITSGVEVVYVTADQAYDGDNEDETGISLGVEVNARRMTGVTDLGSVFSDTSMTFYNVNTLSTGATIGDESSARRTGVMTVRMERTGASTPNNDAANLTVLFDNDYLRPADSVTTGAELHVQMMDLDAAIRDNPTRPLLNNPYTSFIFRVGDQTVSVPISENSETYAQLLADFQAALAANPITAGKVTAVLGPQFQASDTDNDPGGTATGTEILLVNSGPEILTAVQFIAANGVPTDLDFHLQTYNEAPDTTDRLIEVNIELDKVGNGGDLGAVATDPEGANSSQVFAGGGYLTVGGMQTDDEHYEDSILNNTFKNGAIANPGVEQFNIVLEGNAIEDSSLAGIQSTHNALRVINLVNPGSTADIIVGNSNTRYASNVNGATNIGSDGTAIDVSDVRNNAVKDVLLFNAGSFTGDSAVYGMFSDEVVAKYINLVDSQFNPRDDNAQAVWTFGSGDNLVNLNISKVNVAYEGAVTREDFELDVLTNAGDDLVQLQFGNGSDAFPGGGTDVANWYTNAAINAFRYVGGTALGNSRYADMQINVLTGDGSDEIELWGSSIVHVAAGAGNDVVYTDNSGTTGQAFNKGKATWVFNSADDTTWSVNALQSLTRLSVRADTIGTTTGINNLALSVSFQGIETSVIAYVANSNSAAGAATITDLQINQAIKDAINNDPVLSDLLIAEDGPSGTLIVRSLVDGVHISSDLEVSLYPTSSTLLPGQTGHLVTVAELGRLGFNPDGSAISGTTSDRWASDFGLLGGPLTGADSVNTNTNVVDGGTGNDTIVLSTQGELVPAGPRTDPDGSTETIDINGTFGFDTILNFTAAVGVGGVSEVQVVDFDGAVTTRPDGVDVDTLPDEQTGVVTLTLPSGLGTYTVTVDSVAGGANPTTAAEVATFFANAINTDLSNNVTATPNADGSLTINYNAPGTNFGEATVDIVPTVSTSEVQQIDISGGPQVAAASFVVSYGGVGNVQFAIGGATTFTTAAQISAEADRLTNVLFNTFFGTTLVDYTTTVDADSFQVTYPGNTDYSQATASVANSTDVQINATTTVIQNGVPFGLTADDALTTVQGLPPVNGADIFDLTTVMGAPVATNFRNFAPGNGAEEDGATFGERADVVFATLNGGAIVITDTMSASDFGAGAATTEALRINASAVAADTTASASGVGTTRSVVITVNADNVGNFYLITNGTAAGDATASYLGSVELAQYDDAAKDAVGNWDLMSISNFTPLTAETVVNTFNIA